MSGPGVSDSPNAAFAGFWGDLSVVDTSRVTPGARAMHSQRQVGVTAQFFAPVHSVGRVAQVPSAKRLTV